LSNYESQLENIHIINDYIRTNKNLNFFLFGCNVASQFLICNGLDVKNINCILDNATQKHKKYLYGTHLLCNSTDELNHYDNICVITSHMSVYETEIRNSLSKLKNKKLKFI
jgi:hypothetical protein